MCIDFPKEQDATLFRKLGPRLWTLISWCAFYKKEQNMYRVTIYGEVNDKTVDECEDEDEMREMVDTCLDDLEAGSVRSFTVSSLAKTFHEKPFWEKEGS